jgi:arylsulfatase A-like enzyme
VWTRALLLALAIALPTIAVSLARDPSPTSEPARPARAPNVVLILIDALRRDRLPFYGHGRNTAPFLAELAAGGAVFERALTASTWTPSSVASLFTGLYPNQHGVWTGYNVTRLARSSGKPLVLNRIPEGATTLAESLRRLGYRTFGASNNPNFSEVMGFRRGFDRFEQVNDRSAEAINAAVAGFRPELDAARPYFLYLHYMDAHKPYHRRDPWFDPNEPDEDLARYDSEISYADAQIRELVSGLPGRDDMLVILTADHGEEFGEHGGRGHKNQLYAELLRVPLVWSWPGAIAPRRIADDVSLVDVMPTLEALAGAPAPTAPSAGTSLVPLLEGGAIEPRPIFAMRATESQDPPLVRKAVVRDGWKYIVTTPSGDEELYDTVADPADRVDVAAEQADVVARLRAELAAFEAAAPRHARAYAESEKSARELVDQLRALGYVE